MFKISNFCEEQFNKATTVGEDLIQQALSMHSFTQNSNRNFSTSLTYRTKPKNRNIKNLSRNSNNSSSKLAKGAKEEANIKQKNLTVNKLLKASSLLQAPTLKFRA